MGMNYYLRSIPCKECGHSKIERHIGKSSFGWQFHFRGSRFENILSYQHWLLEFQREDRVIYNEEHEIISTKEFMELVESKKDGLNHYNIITYNPETDK